MVDAPPNVPTVTGVVTSWTVAPALPAGLVLDATSGILQGRPEATSPVKKYTVKASNSVGSAFCVLDLGVTGPAHFVYVANGNDDTISIYAADAHSGALDFQGYVHAAAGESSPKVLCARPDGRFLYVANEGDGVSPSTVSVYSISTADGRLTAQAPAMVGLSARDLVLSASSQHLYVAAYGSDAVYVLSVGSSDGALSPVGSPVPSGDGPVDLAIDPSNRFLWSVNRLGGSISTFAIDGATGALTSSTAEAFIGGVPSAITTDASGERVLVTFENTDHVAVFHVDPSDGALTKESEQATGDLPADVVYHPARRFAYVANTGAATLSTFAVDQVTGALSPAGTTSLASLPADVAFDPSGLYAYVIDQGSNEVWTFAVDQGTGALTRTSRIRTRAMPASIAMIAGPAPLLQQGRFLYAVNTLSSDLTSYEVHADGSLVEVGTPALAGNDSRDLAVDPLGRYLVATDAAKKLLTVYSLDSSTGAIGAQWPSTALVGRSRGVSIDPSGQWVYVAVRDEDRAESFAVDVDAHTLTLVSNVAAGSNPHSASVDPTGRFLLVTNWSSDDVYVYGIQDGAIVEPPTVILAPGNPQEPRFSPGGDFVIVPLETADHLATFAIDAQNGALTTVLPGKAVSNGPTAAGVHRSGKFAYAAVHGGQVEQGHLSSFSFQADTARIKDEVDYSDTVHPRDLALDPSGQFLFSADEGTASLSSFVIDPKTGHLALAGSVQTGLAPRAVALTRQFVIQVDP
jgi:6-phosphogluconolactonase (cycloisomerase 2 family)